MAKFSINGLDALRRELRAFPDAVQARAAATGMRKASAKLRTALRRAAYAKIAKGYKRTNKLRQAIRSAVGKRPQFKGKAWVALKAAPGEKRTRYYYKVLEAGRKPYRRYAPRKAGSTRRQRIGGQYAGSPPMKPFWDRTVRVNAAATLRIIVDETRKAIAVEAGKAYARSKAGR